ncbi:MAG: two-component system sensor histidine kinase CreC [Acidobacteria bacterium]|nr:two-component system sensor histidine kinase CreC [Acidobacteriota bacterium]
MRIRTRILLGFLALVTGVFAVLAAWLLGDARVQPLRAVEDALLDTVQVLAGFLESRPGDIRRRADGLRQALAGTFRHPLEARIYEHRRSGTNIHVYVTDGSGVVVYDSRHGESEGKDFSRWNDVWLTLRGRYGSRATRTDPADDYSTVLYVAAPVREGGRLVGVVSVGKPASDVKMFVRGASRAILTAAAVAGLALAGLGLLLTFWVTRPIETLAAWAEAVRQGKRTALPPLGRNEIGRLGGAFEEMRDELEGKRYVEHYVGALTHEIKGPLSSIRGAAELLQEDLPAEDRARFVANVLAESERIRCLSDRLPQLAAIENLKALPGPETLDFAALVREEAEGLTPLAETRGIAIETDPGPPCPVRGDRMLLRLAVSNLVQNALDFTPRGGRVSLTVRETAEGIELRVADNGTGVPDYALDKVFEKFYSLPRPGTRARSSGLGLALVREVALLHGGAVRLENAPAGGALATLRLPSSPPGPTR